MRIDPRLRLEIREQLKDTRTDSRYVVVCIPTVTYTSDTFETDTQSAVDPSSGDGTGITVSSWKIYRILAHIRPVDAALIAFRETHPGVEDGEFYFGVQPNDKYAFDQAYENQYAYVYCDGETYAVNSFVSTGIGQIEQWTITCKKFTPIQRATGY